MCPNQWFQAEAVTLIPKYEPSVEILNLLTHNLDARPAVQVIPVHVHSGVPEAQPMTLVAAAKASQLLKVPLI